jgi:hypothetical protein
VVAFITKIANVVTYVVGFPDLCKQTNLSQTHQT